MHDISPPWLPWIDTNVVVCGKAIEFDYRTPYQRSCPLRKIRGIKGKLIRRKKLHHIIDYLWHRYQPFCLFCIYILYIRVQAGELCLISPNRRLDLHRWLWWYMFNSCSSFINEIHI